MWHFIKAFYPTLHLAPLAFVFLSLFSCLASKYNYFFIFYFYLSKSKPIENLGHCILVSLSFEVSLPAQLPYRFEEDNFSLFLHQEREKKLLSFPWEYCFVFVLKAWRNGDSDILGWSCCVHELYVTSIKSLWASNMELGKVDFGCESKYLFFCFSYLLLLFFFSTKTNKLMLRNISIFTKMVPSVGC